MNFGWKFLDDYEELRRGGGNEKRKRKRGKEKGKSGSIQGISIHDKRTRLQTFFFSLLFTIKFAVQYINKEFSRISSSHGRLKQA